MPSLLVINCLTASGGEAGTTPTVLLATVLRAVVGGDEGLAAKIVDSNGTCAAAVPGAQQAQGGPDTLPVTGARASATGLVLLLLGVLLTRFRQLLALR